MIKDDFREEPQDSTKSVGSQVRLRCKPPRGEPEPVVTWTHNGEIIGQTDKRMTVQGDGDLVIERLRKDDSGEYVCKAHNVAGEKKSSPVELSVIGL